MDGPTSSTWSSTTVRFSPSRVSKERCTRRPCAITRIPLVMDSATFSAASRQMEQRRKRVSPSVHWLCCRSKRRGVDAIVKLATAAPEGVNLSSGSAVRFPITVITVSPAMTLLKPRSARVGSDQLGADDGLVQAELTIEFLGQVRRGVHVHHGVDALGVLVDVVGEPAPTPYVRLVHGPTT